MKKLINKEISIEELEKGNEMSKEELYRMRLSIFKSLMAEFRQELHNIQCKNEQEHTNTILHYELEEGIEVPSFVAEYFFMKDKIVNSMTDVVRELCLEYLDIAKEEK